MYDPILLLITLVFMGAGMLVSARLKTKFSQYAREPLLSRLSGKEVAERMLRENGIYDVKVTSVNGTLTDHYNPLDKTVNLSHEVYNGRNISAAAVAAHECGHAVQHADTYRWLMLRSKLVPTVQIASQVLSFLTLGLAFIAYGSPALTNTMLMIFIVLQGSITIFSLITLPVEIDASNRALAWMENARITHQQEHIAAKDALRWAAYTYLVAALASVATLLYYIWKFASNNRD
ncbi:MAG TPA: zinc metallopeptidase [Bacteroidia bacterium]|nr:zinc metallopeptidase [Bacteroidia bacterium]